jgi:phosphatidylglycerol:prolipoprotein diacylglycerol transferase
LHTGHGGWHHIARRRRRGEDWVFPYIAEPVLNLWGYQLHAFPVLVGLAIYTVFQIVLRRAAAAGIERRAASSLIGWTIFWGLVGAHVFDVVAYTPEKLREDPLELLRLWGSLSSFGGIVSGLTALVILMRRSGLTGPDMLRFADCVLYALPFTLAIGRLGCALQHDHPGVSANHWLAVQFPDGPRFDLGLLEFLYLLPVCALFWWLGRRSQAPGFFVGLFFALYAPVRFWLDSLRVFDARYLGWTPAQYLSLLAAFAGAGFLVWIVSRESDPSASPEAPGS